MRECIKPTIFAVVRVNNNCHTTQILSQMKRCLQGEKERPPPQYEGGKNYLNKKGANSLKAKGVNSLKERGANSLNKKVASFLNRKGTPPF